LIVWQSSSPARKRLPHLFIDRRRRTFISAFAGCGVGSAISRWSSAPKFPDHLDLGVASSAGHPQPYKEISHE
jgi:hypothetical protein